MTRIGQEFFRANLEAFCSSTVTEFGFSILGGETREKACSLDTGIIDPNCPNFPKGHFVLVKIVAIMRELPAPREMGGAIVRHIRVVAPQPSHVGNRYEFRCSDGCGQTLYYEHVWHFRYTD